MAIRPIDMQVAVPRLQEVSRINHLEQQRPSLQGQQSQREIGHHIEKEQKTVVSSQKDARSESEADARKEGRNKYESKKGKKKEGQKDGVSPQEKSYHKIDIRI